MYWVTFSDAQSTHSYTHLTPHTHLTPCRHTTRSKPLPRLALCSDSRRKKRFNHGSKLARWKNDSSGHNVHVRAISTHYAVIWKVMELKPAWGTRLPRAPRTPGPESGSTCCQTTRYHGNTEGGRRRHELWVNLIGWLCSETSVRGMKWGVCCSKLRWINVYTFTYHTHTDAIICGVCFQLWYAACLFTGEHTPHGRVDTQTFHSCNSWTCDCNVMGINVLL